MKLYLVRHGALLRMLHFNIIGYDDDTNFHGAGFKNCELRGHEV